MNYRHALRRLFSSCCVLILALAFTVSTARAQTGHVLNGVGPIDQSWSGAGMAHPQDALTALNWNPATLTTFDATTMDVSLQLMYPSTELSSAIESEARGPNNPPTRMAGTTASETGPFPIPATGFIYRPRQTRWSVGVSAFGVGGFGVDYAASDPRTQGANPVTFPQSAGGFGALNSSFALFQVSPTVAYRLTENVSVGVAPTFNLGMLEVSPFPGARPDQTGYPDGPQTSATGWGFQAGIHAADLNGFHVGLSYKSTQRFSAYEFDSGQRAFSFELDYPRILSAAVAYSGLERFKFVADVRYIDFASTEGFDTAGFDSFGAVTGFGWNSIVTVATGVEYELTSRIPIRIGYAFNENPIDSDVAFYNCASPAIVQHHVSGGLSYRFSDAVMLSAAVQYAPANAVEGPMGSPQRQRKSGTPEMPGTNVKSELSTVTPVMGVNVRF